MSEATTRPGPPRAHGRLVGKVTLVTGAGRGIGRGIASRFAREGAVVVAAQRTSGEVEDLIEGVRAAGGEGMALPLDVQDADSVASVIDRVLDRFGRLDVLCNNAGMGHTGSVAECSQSDYDAVLQTNARGPFLCMKHAIPAMRSHGGGSIINVTSIYSFRAVRNSVAYVTSKGALLSLTQQAALDCAPFGIRVNALAPGFVETEQLRTWVNAQSDPAATEADLLAKIPLARIGTPDDIAGAAVFLASDDSIWITGASLVVDGGTLAQ